MKLGWMIGCAGVTLAACGGKGGGATAPGAGAEPTAPEVKLVALDLGPCGETFQGVAVQAPAGAKAAEDFGACSVKAGATFQIEVHSTGPEDFAKAKAEIGKNDINRFVRWVVEEPELLVYESKVMNSEYHVAAVAKAGDKVLSCEDTKGPTYSEADARVMGKACKTLAKK